MDTVHGRKIQMSNSLLRMPDHSFLEQDALVVAVTVAYVQKEIISIGFEFNLLIKWLISQWHIMPMHVSIQY